MNTQIASMTFFQNHSLQIHIIGNTNPISESQNTLSIQLEIFILSLSNTNQQINKFHIKLLSFSYSIKEIIIDLQHSQDNTLRRHFYHKTHISKLLNNFQLFHHQK